MGVLAQVVVGGRQRAGLNGLDQARQWRMGEAGEEAAVARQSPEAEGAVVEEEAASRCSFRVAAGGWWMSRGVADLRGLFGGSRRRERAEGDSFVLCSGPRSAKGCWRAWNQKPAWSGAARCRWGMAAGELSCSQMGGSQQVVVEWREGRAEG